jgi:Glycine/D-amino acid oxidases (deaminating)
MESIWSNSCTFPERESLHEDLVVDTAVVGAGMAGLLTAYLLTKQGAHVVVLEGSVTAGGITKNTTAKITSQHDLIYDSLVKNFGLELAAQYALANQRAIRTYRDLVSENSIDCDFETKPAFVYTLRDTEAIEAETTAAQRLGIDAEYTTETGLPFPVKAAVRFNDQAQFHPLKFLKAISADLEIYEHTMAREIRNGVVITDRGRVTADHVIVATHFPIINIPGWYFARMHQERSYVIALENAGQVNGMYIDEDPAGYSFRNYGDSLLFGGGGHRTGKHPQEDSYKLLGRAAHSFYPKSREISHWSAQDCVSWDQIPYIGLYSPSLPNVHVATGFKKWGMTSSMAAAMILTDTVCGKKNACADVFSPRRFNFPASVKNLLSDVGHSVAGLTGGAFSGPGRRCAHLGCRLQWNPDENTWDCPCHGSRYTGDGKLIDNPATKGLSK